MPFIIMTMVLGSLNHFVYQWTHGNALAALFCPISESTWEHLKLLFFPFLIFTIWTCFRHKYLSSKYLLARLLGVLCGMLFIVVLFYTYTGVIGRHFLVMDILIYLLSVLCSYQLSDRFYKRPLPKIHLSSVISGWVIVSFCFFIFTCFPPDIPLFFPPQ